MATKKELIVDELVEDFLDLKAQLETKAYPEPNDDLNLLAAILLLTRQLKWLRQHLEERNQ